MSCSRTQRSDTGEVLFFVEPDLRYIENSESNHIHYINQELGKNELSSMHFKTLSYGFQEATKYLYIGHYDYGELCL